MPILDRLVRYDERSLAYPIRPLLAARQPRSYSWRGYTTDQGRQGACFPGGVFVRMADGSHRKIEDVRLLDEVVTAEGRTGRVLQTMVRPASELVEVRAWGHMLLDDPEALNVRPVDLFACALIAALIVFVLLELTGGWSHG